MTASEIVDVATLRHFLSSRFGTVPGEGEGVFHVAAVWRPPGEDRNVVLRICDQTPKSEIDFLLLNLARARADAIVTTGRILRDEPRVTHSLQGPAGLRGALEVWRREVLGLEQPPLLLVITSGRGDPRHPALHDWARPEIFRPQSGAGALRSALDHLRTQHGARRISIEAGPSTARAAYDDPAIDELMLSVFAAEELAPSLAGGELPGRREIERIFGPPRAAFALIEPSGPWTFERYVRDR